MPGGVFNRGETVEMQEDRRDLKAGELRRKIVIHLRSFRHMAAADGNARAAAEQVGDPLLEVRAVRFDCGESGEKLL